MRYAQKHELNLVVPGFDAKHRFRAGQVSGFKLDAITNTQWWKANLEPNFFLLHTRYNADEVAKVLPDFF